HAPLAALLSFPTRRSSDLDYVRSQRELLDRHGLLCLAIGAHLVGQAVCDPIDARHRAILPPELWGDGDPEGVRERAAERMKDTRSEEHTSELQSRSDLVCR